MGRYWLHLFFFVLVFIGLDDIYVIKKTWPVCRPWPILHNYVHVSVLLHAYKVHFVNACIKLMLIKLFMAQGSM